MLQRLLLLGLLCGLMAATTGCGLCHNLLYAPFGPGSICTTNNCGPGCQPACAQPACASCGETSCGDACGETCGSCGETCGDSCGSCGNPCAPCGPLSAVHKLLHPQTWDCGSCGERYWGDFHGDPPECCDPCDRCGNFNGATTDGCNCGGGGNYNMQYSTTGSGCSTCGSH